MENDREVDSVLMNINRTSDGVVRLMAFSSRMSFKMLTFLLRLAKKGMVAAGLTDSLKAFTEKTGGAYTVYNIPISDEKASMLEQINKLQLNLQNEKNPIAKRKIQNEIKNLEKSIPELAQLKELGISHCVLPKLNGSQQTIQVAVAKNDDPIFKNWFVNHISTQMQGGEKSFEGMRVFTEGNYTILNMPFEKTEELSVMMSDFNTMRINYALLPDLNVGDGYTQIAIPNTDRSQVEQWFKLWKEKALAEGNEIGELYAMDGDSYSTTAEVSADDYIHMAEQPYKDVQTEFEKESVSLPYHAKLDKENSSEFVKFLQDDNYEKITINRMRLIEDMDISKLEHMVESAKRNGLFLSRIPGTYEQEQKVLAIPIAQTFVGDGGETFIAFLHKGKNCMVANADGTIEKWGFEKVKQSYDKVSRGFEKAESIKQGKSLEKVTDIAKDIVKQLSPKPTKL